MARPFFCTPGMCKELAKALEASAGMARARGRTPLQGLPSALGVPRGHVCGPARIRGCPASRAKSRAPSAHRMGSVQACSNTQPAKAPQRTALIASAKPDPPLQPLAEGRFAPAKNVLEKLPRQPASERHQRMDPRFFIELALYRSRAIRARPGGSPRPCSPELEEVRGPPTSGGPLFENRERPPRSPDLAREPHNEARDSRDRRARPVPTPKVRSWGRCRGSTPVSVRTHAPSAEPSSTLGLSRPEIDRMCTSAHPARSTDP